MTSIRSRTVLYVCMSLLLGCASEGGSDTSTTFASFDGGVEDSDSAESGSAEGDGDPGDGDPGDGDPGDGDPGDGDPGDGDGDGVKFDMARTPDAATGDGDGDSGGECIDCSVTLDSTQSSSFVALPGTEYLGFATLQQDQIIYALDEAGSGRVIYTADTNLLYLEITDCPLWEWLGQTGDQLPEVLSFGRYLCDGLGNNLGNYPSLTYAGTNLPAQYVNNPAALAADYDAVIYCTLASSPQAELLTIVDYVRDHGGGLYLASEYWGFINQGDLDAVNTIAVPLGTQFQNTNLDWGQANGDIAFECFPPPQ